MILARSLLLIYFCLYALHGRGPIWEGCEDIAKMHLAYSRDNKQAIYTCDVINTFKCDSFLLLWEGIMNIEYKD